MASRRAGHARGVRSPIMPHPGTAKPPFGSVALVALLFLPAMLLARDAREQARIDYLVRRVENSTGVEFIRNGKGYDGVAAAAHLGRKLGYAGGRVKTAEDFVKNCASESSLTHQKYQIRLADGSMMDAASYFTEQLREFDLQRK